MDQQAAKNKARELINIFYLIDIPIKYARQCARICIEDKYNGILYVLGELWARRELSRKIYLKVYDDLILEKKEVLKELE